MVIVQTLSIFGKFLTIFMLHFRAWKRVGKYEFPKGKEKVFVVLWYIFVLCRLVLREDGDVYIVKSRKLIAFVLISAVDLMNMVKKKDKLCDRCSVVETRKRICCCICDIV